MNSVNESAKSTEEVSETCGSQQTFQKVFKKYSAFTQWADSSSEDDLFEGAQTKQDSESEERSVVPVASNEPNIDADFDESCSEKDFPFENFAKDQRANGKKKNLQNILTCNNLY